MVKVRVARIEKGAACRHLARWLSSVAERREAARELAEEGHSTRAIGEVLGVSQMTAVRDIETNASSKPEESSGSGRAAETNVSALNALAALTAGDWPGVRLRKR
jgi:hypothetical protein